MTAQVQDLHLDELHDSPYQPRGAYDEDALRELTESIRANGFIGAITVRPVGETWEIVGGHRRTRAARAAGLTSVPALVRDLSDDDARRFALVDNLAREDLLPWEEGAGYLGLMDTGMSMQAVAKHTGRAFATVQSRVAIAEKVGDRARAAFTRREIGVAHLEALADLPDEPVFGKDCPACRTACPPDADRCPCGRDLSATLAYPWGNPQEVALKQLVGKPAPAAAAIAAEVAAHYGLGPQAPAQVGFDLAVDSLSVDTVVSRTALDKHLAAVGRLEHWLAEHGAQVRHYTGEQRAAALAQATVAARIISRVIQTIEEVS